MSSQKKIIGAAELHTGDCIAVLRAMPDNSVDSIVTDPPYELGFMGKSWDKSGIANSVEMWREALRVLKPGGHLLAFSGSRTYHRMTCAIEDAGFEVRDQIMWVYGSGFPKSHNLTGEHAGWGTALKPAHEPICVARKPLAEKTVAANVLTHGTGALNIDACRVGDEVRTYGLKGGENLNKLARDGGNDAEDAKGCGAYGVGAKQVSIGTVTVAGRWPANLIHDGSEEVIALFPANAGAAAPVKGTEASSASIGNVTGKRDRVAGAFHADAGSAARFFYSAKASSKDREEGLDLLPLRRGGPEETDASLRDGVGDSRMKLRRNIHPAVKPTDLMRYLCRMVTQPGGIVLDLFMGSGSTGKAAMLEGFRFVGIDLSPEYVEIAAARIAQAQDRAEAEVKAASARQEQLELIA